MKRVLTNAINYFLSFILNCKSFKIVLMINQHRGLNKYFSATKKKQGGTNLHFSFNKFYENFFLY